MLEELGGHVLIGRILESKFERDAEQVEGEHGHPGGAVRLVDAAAGGERAGAVENGDVIQAKKAAAEDVAAAGVLAVPPPGEIEQELMERLFQEVAVGHAVHCAVHLENPKHGPGMHRRVHVAECPLIGRQLPVRVHVALAHQ